MQKTETNMLTEKQDSNNKYDYTVEATRVWVIILVVISHMLLYTYLTGKSNIITYLWNAPLHEILLFSPVAYSMGTLIFLSGFVYGMKTDFQTPDSLTKSTYGTHVKKRFLRLFIGYYLALTTVFIAKLIVGFPMEINPMTLILDITNTWGLLFGTGGVIWPEGWFIAAIFWLSISYPFIKRLMAKNKAYIYLLIYLGITLRVTFIMFGLYGYSYTNPFSYLAEFCCGMLIGDYLAKRGKAPKVAKTRTQKAMVTLGARVFPIYLAHSAIIVLISFRPPFWEYIIASMGIIVLSEIFYRVLKEKDKFLKKKGII